MIKVKVYYEDTDAGGVVYYANYLKYFERVRTEYFRQAGLDAGDLLKKGITFVVVRTEINYKRPAQLYDTLNITCSISEITGASFWVNYTITREDGTLIVTGRTKMACVSPQRKLLRLTDEMIVKLTRGNSIH